MSSRLPLQAILAAALPRRVWEGLECLQAEGIHPEYRGPSSLRMVLLKRTGIRPFWSVDFGLPVPSQVEDPDLRACDNPGHGQQLLGSFLRKTHPGVSSPVVERMLSADRPYPTLACAFQALIDSLAWDGGLERRWRRAAAETQD